MYHFVEINTLRFADAPDSEAAALTTVDAALRDAAAVVAHFSSAAIVLESAARLGKATLLVGTDAIGRDTVKQLPARIIEGNGSCAMIESPQAVADILHAMIAERVA